MNIKIELTFRELYFLYFVQISTALIIIPIDIYYHIEKYDIYFWICQYIPNITINFYIISIFYCWICCAEIFNTVNNVLKPLCCLPLNPIEKYLICKKNIKSGILFKKCKQTNKIYFEKIFNIHNETCNIIRRLEYMSLLEFSVFFYYTITAIAALCYDAALDVIRISNGLLIASKGCYGTVYTPIIATIIFLSTITFGSRTMHNSNRTRDYFHKLINLYPKLIPYVSI